MSECTLLFPLSHSCAQLLLLDFCMWCFCLCCSTVRIFCSVHHVCLNPFTMVMKSFAVSWSVVHSTAARDTKKCCTAMLVKTEDVFDALAFPVAGSLHRTASDLTAFEYLAVLLTLHAPAAGPLEAFHTGCSS